MEAPLLYFFVNFYLKPNSKIYSVEKTLLIPFLFFLINTLLYKGIAFTTSQNWQEHPLLIKLAELNVFYGDFVNISSLLLVLSLALYKIIKYQNQINKYDRKTVQVEFIWLKVLLLLILLVLIYWGYYAAWFYLDQSISYLPVDVVVSILIYVLGYIGIHKLNIINERKHIREQTYQTNSCEILSETRNWHEAKIEELVIDEKRFLDPNYSLEILANELQLSKSHVSRIFNNEMKVSFSDYINTLRVEEAKKYLKNPHFANYTLVAIGLEAGFNSKTTFNTTFKKITGQTPSQFKKER